MKKNYYAFEQYLINEFKYVPEHIFYDLEIEQNKIISYYFELCSNDYILHITDRSVEICKYEAMDILHMSTDGLDSDEYFNFYLIDELSILAKIENVHKIRKYMHEVIGVDYDK